MPVFIDLMPPAGLWPAKEYVPASMGLKSDEVLRLKVIIRQDMDRQLQSITSLDTAKACKQSAAFQWLRNRAILHKLTQPVPHLPNAVVDHVSVETLKGFWIQGFDQTGV